MSDGSPSKRNPVEEVAIARAFYAASAKTWSYFAALLRKFTTTSTWSRQLERFIGKVGTGSASL
jgi:hypothetical protein